MLSQLVYRVSADVEELPQFIKAAGLNHCGLFINYCNTIIEEEVKFRWAGGMFVYKYF